MHQDTNRASKTLSVFSLVAINIIAVDSLRTLPFGAQYGFSLVFYYLLAAVLFFIPVSLVSAELATGWPETGGIYIWVREAFGRRLGFLTIWLQWIYNVVWYPTILAFVASTLTYLFNPQWAESKAYLCCTILGIFWCATFLNWFGMRVSSFISTLGAIVGTLLPMFFIIILSMTWLCKGGENQLIFSWKTFFPKSLQLNEFVFFSAILFGLVGMEMSAVHAGDVKNPSRDYPKALLYSTIIILLTLILGSLAIAIIVPSAQLNVVTGLMEAFKLFLAALQLQWLMPVVTVLIILGGICGVSTWVIGPTKGLMIASNDGLLPAVLAKKNRHGAPGNLLLLQAVLFSVLSSLFVSVDNISESYWLLSDLTAQLALLAYVFMFSAAIHLRKYRSDVKRAYQVPGANWVFYLVAGIGLCTCVVVIALGFVPPSHIKISGIWFYEGFLWGGLVIFVLIPWLLSGLKNRETRDERQCS